MQVTGRWRMRLAGRAFATWAGQRHAIARASAAIRDVMMTAVTVDGSRHANVLLEDERGGGELQPTEPSVDTAAAVFVAWAWLVVRRQRAALRPVPKTQATRPRRKTTGRVPVLRQRFEVAPRPTHFPAQRLARNPTLWTTSTVAEGSGGAADRPGWDGSKALYAQHPLGKPASPSGKQSETELLWSIKNKLKRHSVVAPVEASVVADL